MTNEGYGENTTNAIFGGCATKAFFNPNDDISADKFSKYLGDEEINYTQKSRSYGGKGGANTSISQQKGIRKLFDVNQFNTLPEGKAVLMNPGFSSRNQISLPMLHKFKIPQVEINSQKSSIKHWYEFQQDLIALSSLVAPTSEEMMKRRKEAERLLPLFDKQELLKTMEF
ncbi:TraM recognition domain-containing protein [Nostoc sp. CHAB 5844]|nr:TraM recognition domain-containing protein [Nostoc sp. CHAB 5844]